MPRLTFTNVLAAPVTIGDQTGLGRSFSIPAGGLTIDLTGRQLEELGPELQAVRTKGWVTWVTTENPNVPDEFEILAHATRPVIMAAVTPATKGTTDVHAAFVGSTGRASLSLLIGTADIDTVVEAATGGAAGNAVTVALTGDSPGAGGVTISRVGTALTIHYESGVSTVGNVETAIAALAGADDIINIRTAGTGATVLTSPDDDVVATALAGGSATGNNFPGAFTNPDVPRNLRITMAANWDGGDVTVVGTNQFDATVSESFTTGSGVTRVGTKIFKTVTSATKALYGSHPTATASIGTGDKLGAELDITGTTALLYVDDALDAVTVDATYDAYTPTTLPNGARVYKLVANTAA